MEENDRLRKVTSEDNLGRSNFKMNSPGAEESYGSVLKELGESAKDLIQSEIFLLTEEFKATSQKVKKDLAEVVAFGTIMALSVFPLLAFFVIGLGNILDGRYWLSSLLVAVLCAGIGGPMAYRALKKIKEQDIDFSRTRRSLDRSAQTIQRKFDEVKVHAKGENHEAKHFH